MSDWTEQFSKLGLAMIKKVKLGNVLDAPLTLSIFVVFGCVVAFVLTREIFLLFIAAMPLVIFAIGFLYFMLSDPSKLRSEEHTEKMFQMSVGLGEAGKKEISEEKLDEMKSITNPASKKIGKKEDES